MKTYTKLWDYLIASDKIIVRLTFDDVEKLVEFKLEHGSSFDKLESVHHGYEVIDYLSKEQYVVFRKIDQLKKDD